MSWKWLQGRNKRLKTKRGVDLVRIEGFISKKVVRYWLENYQSLATGDRPPDAVPSNSGPKVADGWNNSKLNKIMLDEAMAKIPDKLTKACLHARWVLQMGTSDAVLRLNISREEYKKRCNEALDFVYHKVNGGAVGVKKLMEAIIG